MSSRNSCTTLRSAAQLGLLAAAIGSSGAPVAQAARVRCRVTSASSTTIAAQDGFANALVELAEFACNGSGEGTVPINERVTGVASAMAQAVAEVVGTCSGQGNARATVSGLSRAETRAEAVGTASARILATSEVCGLCSSALDSFSTAIETVAATAVAEASISAEFVFEEGATQTFTVKDIQNTIQENIIDLLSTVTGQIRTSATDGCSANAIIRGEAGASFATCDVAISADDILEEVNAVADAGVEVQAHACAGDGNEAEIHLISREVARAVAQGVVQADSFCETSGGPGTMACGLTNGTINAVARATATALAAGMAEARSDDCNCDLSTAADISEVEEIMAAASTAALAQICAEGEEFALASDFQIEVVERMGVAIADVIGFAASGDACSVDVSLCAEAAQCVESAEQCSGPGVEGTLACCEEDQVCASMFGGAAFRCLDRSLVKSDATAEVLECS